MIKLSLPLPWIILALTGFAIAEPHAPASEDPEFAVRATAAAFLSGYVKKQADHHLCALRLSDSPIRIELDGLHLGRVIANPVSPADQANGITESRLVLMDYSTYRAHGTRTALWSRWSVFPNPLLPGAIRVEKGPDGQWRANPKDFQLLCRLATRNDPAIVPHDAQPAHPIQASK